MSFSKCTGIVTKSIKASSYLLCILCMIIIFNGTFSGNAHASNPQAPTYGLYNRCFGACLSNNPPCPDPGTLGSYIKCNETNYYNTGGLQAHGTISIYAILWDQWGPSVFWGFNGAKEHDLTMELRYLTSGTDNPPLERNLGNKGCGQCGGTMLGNPVNISNGNKYEDEVDFVGNGRFPLTFHRYYNSAGLGDNTIGADWLHTFSRNLAIQSTSEIKLIRDDGSIFFFNKCGSLWCPTSDEIGSLVEQINSSGATTGYQYTDGNNIVETYDAAGRFLSETDSAGFVHVMTYNVADELTAASDSYGRKITFGYDSTGRINQLTAPDGSVTSYSYDSNGNLSTITRPDNSVRTYFYDEASDIASGAYGNLLTGIQDEAGQRFATYQYDSNSRTVVSKHANGTDAITATYNSDGSVTTTNALGQARTYTFQTIQNANHLSTSTGPGCSGCGVFASYAYNAAGDLTNTVDFNGNKTLYSIDSAHLEESRTEASGTSSQRTINTSWNTTLRVPLTQVVLDANSNVVSNKQWIYNSVGQTLAHCEIDPTNSATSGYTCSNSGTVPAGMRRWTYTYCTVVDTTQCPIVGLMLTATGPRTDTAQTTTYSYYLTSSAANCGTPGAACYQAGDLHTITDPQGHVTTITSYDGAGRITRMIDANGVNTDLTYMSRGWLASSNVGGATTSFTYTAYGAVQTVTDPDGVITIYGYDAAHRLVKITDAQGNYTQYTLDAAGNKTAEQLYDSTGTLHQSLSRSFNALSQLTKVMDGINHTVFDASASNSYDANGNLVQSADGLGIQRQQGYDALNRLMQTIDNYNGTN